MDDRRFHVAKAGLPKPGRAKLRTRSRISISVDSTGTADEQRGRAGQIGGQNMVEVLTGGTSIQA
jgi:hypothetical protein